MLSRRDQKLTDLQPSIPWDDWIEGLEAIINDSSYHSDEISESDEEKVQEEKNRNIRPSRNENSNHVIHVYDKQWRSSKVGYIHKIRNIFIYILLIKFLSIDSKFFTTC